MAIAEPAAPAADTEQLVVLSNMLDGMRHTNRKNNRALVFVHGFTGTQFETWTHRKSKTQFDALIAKDPELADYDVFLFGYTSTWWNGSRVELLAKNLRMGLEKLVADAAKADRHYHLVLVAHSLGGLVCMRYLIDCLSGNVVPPIRGLVLYGTPTTGTGLVSVAKLAAARRRIQVSAF